MNTSEQSQSIAIRLSTAASTPSPIAITQADAVAMIRWRCQKPSHVESADSHLIHSRKTPHHQSWSRITAGHIGCLKTGFAMAPLKEGLLSLTATTLYDNNTIIICPSAEPFHTAIKEQYSVKPPEYGNGPQISRLCVTDKGIYSVKHERKHSESFKVAEMTTSRMIGNPHLAFEWTTGDVKWHPFKEQVTDTQIDE